MGATTFARMVDELQGLDRNIQNLKAALSRGIARNFQGAVVSHGLPEDVRADLREQLGHMESYRAVLARRIAKHAKEL